MAQGDHNEGSLNSISKFVGSNLYGKGFLWKSEPNWAQQEQHYLVNQLKKNQNSKDFLLATRQHFPTKHLDTHKCRYILEKDQKPLGYSEIESYVANYGIGFIATHYSNDCPEKIKQEATSFLISITFFLGQCDQIRFASHLEGYKSMCQEKKGQVLTFQKHKETYHPLWVHYTEIQKSDWLKDGPGKKHETALLYLTPQKPTYQEPTKKSPLAMRFLRRY